MVDKNFEIVVNILIKKISSWIGQGSLLGIIRDKDSSNGIMILIFVYGIMKILKVNL